MAARIRNGKAHDFNEGDKDQLACGFCGQVLDSILKLLQHKTTHLDRGVGRGCEICQLAFSRQAALIEHYKRKHSIFFDSIQDIIAENDKLEKGPPKKKKKVSKKEKFVASKLVPSLTEVSLPVTTKTSVNLPNGVKLDVVVENNMKSENANVHDNTEVNSLSDSLEICRPTMLPQNNSKSLFGPNPLGLANDNPLHRTGYSVSSAADTTLTDAFSPLTCTNSISSVSTFSVSTTSTDFLADRSSSSCITPESLTSFKDFTGSLSAIGSITSRNNPAVSPVCTESTSVSIPVGLSNPSSVVTSQQSLDSQDVCKVIEIDDGSGIGASVSYKTNVIKKMSNGPKYIVIKSVRKDIAGDITKNHSNQTDNARYGNNLEMNKLHVLPKEDQFVEDKLVLNQTEEFKSAGEKPQTVVFGEIDATSKHSVDVVDKNNYVNDNEELEKPELDSASLNTVEKEAESSESFRAQKSVPLKLGHLYNTRNLKKKTKLTPMAGKIPQELDMPDFSFQYVVTKSGTHSKNMNAGRDHFKCLFCPDITKWRGNMCRHMREVHAEILNSGAALIMPLQVDDKEGKVMKMTEYMEIEAAKNPSKRVRGVESQDLPGEYPCEQCGKVFNRLRYLRIHLQQHRLKNDYLCSLCSKTFKTKNNLNQHLKTHEERGPYKCPECDFESAINIAIHKHRQIHSGNSLICDICGQAYSDKSTLKKHKRVHDSSRPYGCSIPGCTWRFRTRVMRDAHIQGHGVTRTFKCNLCGYAFRQKHHLHRHEKVVHNIVHEPKPTYSGYYNDNTDTDFNKNQFEHIAAEDGNEMEVSQEVNLIINDGNMSNVITTDQFDLESALQNGHLVIAADGGSINYEMSDIGSNVVYQTFLPDGEVQQYETQSVSISQSDTGEITFEGVETIQSEVEIEQS